MKVLFLEENLRGIDKLGPLYLARMLIDNGHEVDLLQTDYDHPLAYLINNKVDWVMFSIMTGQEAYVRRMAEVIKTADPSIKICIGGPHVTFDLSYSDKESNVDVFVRGPGELVISPIVEGKITDRVIDAPCPDFGQLPSPYRNILYKYPEHGKAKMKRFITTRGCPFSCSYCFNNSLKKLYPNDIPKFLHRTSPKKMIREILDVRDEFGLGYVYFNDDNFAFNHKWIHDFCVLYKEQIDLPFATSMRADTVNADILHKLANAGLVFTNFALETHSEDLQKNLLNRGNISNESIESATNICKELGIKVRLQNMIGLPIEDPLEEALRTLEYNIKIDPDDSWCAIFQPEPSTQIYDYSVEHGYLDPKNLNGKHMTFYESSVLNIKDKKKIERLQQWWFFLAKYRVDMEFTKVLLEFDLSDADKRILTNLKRKIARKVLYDMDAKEMHIQIDGSRSTLEGKF